MAGTFRERPGCDGHHVSSAFCDGYNNKTRFCDPHHSARATGAQVKVAKRNLGAVMTITDASFAPANPSAWVQGNRLRRGISLWHRFFTKVFAGPTPKAEDEILSILSDTSTIYRPRCGSSSSAAA